MEILKFFINMDKNFFVLLQKMILMICFIAIISSISTQVLKKVISDVFLYKKNLNIFYFIFNIIFVAVYVFLSVLIYLELKIKYIMFLVLITSVISIFCYDYFLKFIFLGFEIIEELLKSIKNRYKIINLKTKIGLKKGEIIEEFNRDNKEE